MTNDIARESGNDAHAFLAGGGEMGERIRAFDWSKTPLGPAESWSPALRMAVRLMLANRLPMLLWWGPDYISIYNDPYRPVLGNKHPWGLGLRVRECWKEIWHVLRPLIDTPFQGGPATWDEDILLVINRYGFNEETHWLIAYSPVPDESVPSGIGGVLATVHETTSKVVGERRMAALRDLGSRSADKKTAEAACVMAASTLETHPKDIPFALFYLLDADGKQARLAAMSGAPSGQDISPAVIDMDGTDMGWPLSEAKRTMEPQVVPLVGRFRDVPPGPWPDPPKTAVVLPIGSGKPDEPAGFLVAGVSSRLKLDEAYRGFLDLVATQIATAIANAQAYEIEKRRAEALAELDRAKTTFFSNVSHEFRTPLTLILGPLDDAIGDTHERWQRDRLLTLQRNALRLQKLVNTLLDFSRIEAGRVQASFQPVELSVLTGELASNFRSACEKAGLDLRVDCPPLPEPVYVDAEMWEKIVLNLVSNAFKFTLKGRIEVTLQRSGRHAQLVVRDTGVGIPADQMPLLFKRFHRVEGVTGRSQEGSGIGLALVRELVRLHGGEVSAESEVGRGTAFVVSIPFGSAHLQGKRIVPATLESTALRPTHYVEEALRWVADVDFAGGPLATVDEGGSTKKFRILLADDNADMRQYLQRLLSENYHVEVVSDGEAALEAVKRSLPDLVLTDVMMPRLDGFGLLKALRGEPSTSGLPVVMLTARVGEENRIEGMEAGADDYLVKPFSAKELLARVGAQVQMARLRREANESRGAQQAELNEAQRLAHVGSWRWNASTNVTTGSNELFRVYGLDPNHAFPDFNDQDGTLYPHEEWQRINREAQETLRTGVGYELDVQAFRKDEPIWLTIRSEVVRNASGEVVGLRGTVQDISDRKQAEAALVQRQQQLHLVADNAAVLIAQCDSEGRYKFVNRPYAARFGLEPNQVIGKRIPDVVGQPAFDTFKGRVAEVMTGKTVEFEVEIPDHTGGAQFMRSAYTPEQDESGKVIGFVAAIIDISERKRAEQRLQISEQWFRLMADAVPVLIWVSDQTKGCTWFNKSWLDFTGRPMTELVGNGWAEDVHADDFERCLEVYTTSFDARQAFTMEYRLRRHDDEFRWVVDTGIPRYDTDGAFAGYIGSCVDITDSKLAEQALRHSEVQERLRADELETVMAAVPAVVWIAHDTACHRITGNQASYDLLRLPNRANQSLTAVETTERPVHFKVMKDGVELLPHQLPVQLAATGIEVRDFEEEIVFDDGVCINLFGHAMPLRNETGQVRGSIAAFVDITDRKKAEQAVRQSEALFRSMADNAPAMLWVTDSTGCCTYLSVLWYEFTGRTPGKDVGDGWLEAIHSDDLAETKRTFLNATKDHLPFSIDYRVRRHDGEYRWVVDAGIPRFDGNTFQGFVGCVFDVHDRKLAEEANSRLVENLRHADQRKDEFLATLAHELRNPLAPIRTGLQIMRLANGDLHSIEQARSMMERQLGQMVHLVDDLLDLSRISRGKIELRKERIELAKVVQLAVETSRPLIEQAGHELTITVPPGPIYVDADMTRLAQVFSNLLNNAAKYTERGGRIHLAVQRRGAEGEVSVKDNGVGIPAHMLPKVFEIFTQVDRNLERSQGGLGIGLSIVKRLVEMHGGSVHVESDGPGMGSEFVVRLPIVLSVAPRNRGKEEASRPSSRRRILVVDDNKDAAISLAMMLKLMGNETKTAHDGLEALDVAAGYRPDLILLDIGMPRLNGHETAKRIRELPWGKGVVLVALTGWGQDEDRRKSDEAGFDSHIVKPVEPAALAKLLANLGADTARPSDRQST